MAADPVGALVEHVARTRFEDLPAAAVEVVKKGVVDTVGSIVAGSSAEMGRIVTAMARENGGAPQATLFVDGTRVPAAEAAFANAIMGRCRELDDVHESSPRGVMGHGGHVNVMIVPAALAAAEAAAQPIDGREFIAAALVGGDLIPRLRLAAGAAGRLGWEGPTVGGFGVAATAGRLMGLDRAALASAMGAAYAQAAGNVLSTTDGSWDVWLNAGVATRAGVLAADLARRGHHGATAPLLGSSGLYPLYFRGEFHEEALLGGLGSAFESAAVSIKPYASCKGTHHAIYTTLELKRRHGIDPRAIERIEIRTCQYSMKLVVLDSAGRVKGPPKGINDAQFSLAFTVAMALFRDSVFSDDLTEAALDDPEILDLFARIRIVATPEKDELQKVQGYPPDDIDIHMRDGAVFRGCETPVKGHPGNPMSFEEVAGKFRRCVRLSARPIAAAKVDRFLDLAADLDRLDDVRPLVAALH